MTNTMFPRQFQVGSRVVSGEGTAVMLRNFELAKTGSAPEIEKVAPSAELLAFAEKVESLPLMPSIQDIVDAGLISFPASREHASDTVVVIDDAEMVGEIEVVLNEVYAVAEDESNHPLLAQRDDEESRLHQIYDELSGLDIVSLRKRASAAGLKGAYKGYAKSALVAFLFNKAKSA